MRYVGIDLHKDTAFVVVVEGGYDGAIVHEEELPTDLDRIRQCIRDQGRQVQVAIESTSAWYWLVDGLREDGVDVRLAHPKKVRLIAESSKKTDRNDARELADLLRMNRLPEAHIASQEARDRRDLLRHRARLVRVAAQATNRIRAAVRKLNLKPPVKSMTSKSGRAWLRSQEFPEMTRLIIGDQVALIETIQGLVGEIEKRIGEAALKDPRVELLATIPGVGAYTALTVLSEIDTIERFPSDEKLAAYFGLVPRVRGSAGTVRHGHISKEGSQWARWLLVQSAWVAVRQPGRFQMRFRRIARRRGKKIAATAVARDLVTVIYVVLTRNEPFSAEKARGSADRSKEN